VIPLIFILTDTILLGMAVYRIWKVLSQGDVSTLNIKLQGLRVLVLIMYCVRSAIPDYAAVSCNQNLLLMTFYNLFSLTTGILMAFILWKIGSNVKEDRGSLLSRRTNDLENTYRTGTDRTQKSNMSTLSPRYSDNYDQSRPNSFSSINDNHREQPPTPTGFATTHNTMDLSQAHEMHCLLEEQ